jgi:peptidoglycan hydrolase-like protein with peptidoglycan-binding domain
LAAGAVLLVALAAATVVLAQIGSPEHTSADTGVPAGETTTVITLRTLTESSTVDGTLGYGSTLELYDRLSGTFTWLPAVGAVIGRGRALFRLDNLPVMLMYGSVPAYRALKEGVSDGPDVTELNENLIDLGFDPYGAINDVDEFSEATAAAVRRWQEAAGLAQTGEVELGRVVFAPGARRVTQVHVTLGQDPPGGAALKHKRKAPRKPAAGKAAPKQPASKQPVSEEPAAKAPASKQPASKEGAEPGAGAGMVVLSTTSTQQLVQLKVKAEQQSLAHVGEVAPVTLPGGDVVAGHITEVGSVAESKEAEKGPGGGEKGASPSGEGEAATISVTLALARPVARLDEAPVSVELVKSVRHAVLTVPATALTATAGGGYAIEALQRDRRIELAVTPGMFADGYVQVEGAGVHEGVTVVESE